MPPLTPDDPKAVEIQCAGCGVAALVARADMTPEMEEGVLICEDCAPRAEQIITEIMGRPMDTLQILPGGRVMAQGHGGLPTVREMGELAVAFARACQVDDIEGSRELYTSLPLDARMGLTIYLGKLLAFMVSEDEAGWERMIQWATDLPNVTPGSLPPEEKL